MGAYSPLPWADPKLVDEVLATVLQPTVDELRRRGTPFSGLLYAGLAITSRGVRVIEFNARFGDPETQVVLARLKTPLAGLLLAAATGALDRASRRCAGATAPRSPWSSPRTTTRARRAPATRSTGLAEVAAQDAPKAYVLHAGTRRDDASGAVVSAGGRVLSVTATGADLARPASGRTGRWPGSACDGSHAPHGHRGEGRRSRERPARRRTGPGARRRRTASESASA